MGLSQTFWGSPGHFWVGFGALPDHFWAWVSQPLISCAGAFGFFAILVLFGLVLGLGDSPASVLAQTILGVFWGSPHHCCHFWVVGLSWGSPTCGLFVFGLPGASSGHFMDSCRAPPCVDKSHGQTNLHTRSQKVHDSYLHLPVGLRVRV